MGWVYCVTQSKIEYRSEKHEDFATFFDAAQFKRAQCQKASWLRRHAGAPPQRRQAEALVNRDY